MIGRPSGLIQCRVAEAEGFHIQALDEGVDYADWILSRDVSVQRIREED